MVSQENNMVSIVVACYNGERFIDQCMRSLVNQTYTNIEIIICDDYSKDASRDLIRKWAEIDNRIKYIFLDKNNYSATARNRCIDMAKGKYIAIQDIDDISYENRIERLVFELEKKDEYSMISSSMSVFCDKPGDSEEIMSRNCRFPNKWTFLMGIPHNHPATLFKADCIKKIGGYAVGEKTRRIEDYDLFARLYAIGYKGINLSESLYYYRQDYNCIKRRSLKSRLEGISVMNRDFKMLKVYPIAYPFLLKPILGYFLQAIKYKRKSN